MSGACAVRGVHATPRRRAQAMAAAGWLGGEGGELVTLMTGHGGRRTRPAPCARRRSVLCRAGGRGPGTRGPGQRGPCLASPRHARLGVDDALMPAAQAQL